MTRVEEDADPVGKFPKGHSVSPYSSRRAKSRLRAKPPNRQTTSVGPNAVLGCHHSHKDQQHHCTAIETFDGGTSGNTLMAPNHPSSVSILCSRTWKQVQREFTSLKVMEAECGGYNGPGAMLPGLRGTRTGGT